MEEVRGLGAGVMAAVLPLRPTHLAQILPKDVGVTTEEVIEVLHSLAVGLGMMTSVQPLLPIRSPQIHPLEVETLSDPEVSDMVRGEIERIWVGGDLR
jgi:hypothetical protein